MTSRLHECNGDLAVVATISARRSLACHGNTAEAYGTGSMVLPFFNKHPKIGVSRFAGIPSAPPGVVEGRVGLAGSPGIVCARPCPFAAEPATFTLHVTRLCKCGICILVDVCTFNNSATSMYSQQQRSHARVKQNDCITNRANIRTICPSRNLSMKEHSGRTVRRPLAECELRQLLTNLAPMPASFYIIDSIVA